jgi:hypothetical protein
MQTKKEIKENYLNECFTLIVERAYLLGRLDGKYDLECDTNQLDDNIKDIIETLYEGGKKE